jgi:hypothetical protein
VARLVVIIALLLGLAPGGFSLVAEEQPQKRVVFTGGNDLGEAWANVALTRQRLGESYLPMVVMIVNHSRGSITIDRDAIRLVAGDGKRYPMPTLKELRKNYGKFNFDRRAVSATGIPYEVWQRDRRLIDSNFFPQISVSRGAIAIDEVTLPPSYAMIDLVYFAKPSGLRRGDPFLVEIQPIGWDSPVVLGIVLD